MTLANAVSIHRGSLESILEAARRRIEVAPEELAEARKRRNAIAAALKKEFGGRVYVNGSIAHGDALTPLTDVDLGVVIPDPDHEYGPGKKGPTALKERAAEAVRRELKAEYGDLAVFVEGRKRSILVRFRDPIRRDQPDFTADVIVAVDNPYGDGLYIPRYQSWDRSHPEKHTAFVAAANTRTESRYARVVRLVKHWSRTHDKPLCSWHIKALALDSITTPTDLVPGLLAWFQDALNELETGDTQDPAGVSGPIKIDKKWTKRDVLAELRGAITLLNEAITYEQAGYLILAQDKLAKLFKDPQMLPAPEQRLVLQQQQEYFATHRPHASTAFGAPALITSTNPTRDRVNTRSWGE